MIGLEQIRKNQPLLARIIEHKQHGFLRNEQVEQIKQFAPHLTILVRCGAGRFTCAAQDAVHFANIIDRSETDYVRDLALLAG